MEELIHNIEDILKFVGVLFDVIGVIAIVIGFFLATANFLRSRERDAEDPTRQYRLELGRALIVCLEILVAADIIRTVAVELTVDNLLALGLLVLIRTFLSWTLEIEVDGHFPWQRKPAPDQQPEAPSV